MATDHITGEFYDEEILLLLLN